MATSPRLPADTQTYSKRRMPPPYDTAYAVGGRGCWLETTRGRTLDFVAGLGPVILGYQDPAVTSAVHQTLLRGEVGMSLPTVHESLLADMLAGWLPCAESSRFFKNGADALQAGVRLARAATGRVHVLRCGYHGWLDWCQDSPGVPASVQSLTHDVPFGDLNALEAALLKWPVAVFVSEPIVSQNPVEPPPHYWPRAHELCRESGAVLMFDEVVTGFRMPAGSAQATYHVTPDLAAVSKAMANGFPISALVGRDDLMDQLVPGGVFASTTFGGDPVGLTAACATLHALRERDALAKMAAFGTRLHERYDICAKEYGVETWLIGYPTRLIAQFGRSDHAETFARLLASHGILAPNYYNIMYAHTLDEDAVWDRLLPAWDAAFAACSL